MNRVAFALRSGRPFLVAVLCEVIVALPVALVGVASAASISPPHTFLYTGGEQTYTVPPGVTELAVDAVGAPGGAGRDDAGGIGGAGGIGARVDGQIAVTPGELLYVEVGGTGEAGDPHLPASPAFNGGGAPGLTTPLSAGGGGGASDIRTISCGGSCPGDSASLHSRLLVAAGGGGGGGAGQLPGAAGGSGGAGGPTGSAGTGGGPLPCLSGSGGGGGPSAGGAGGPITAAVSTCFQHFAAAGQDGSLGTGGTGGAFDASVETPASGGGGGGGYYGGGGGASGSGAHVSAGAGGGGGSSFGPPGSSVTPAPSGVSSVTVTPLPPAAQASLVSLSFAAQPRGTVGSPQTVTISDAGGSPLTVTGMLFAGADPADFFIGSDSCRGQVDPGASCQVTVWFAPQGPGLRSATLDVSSNDPSGLLAVNLSGLGGAPSNGTPGPQGLQGVPGPSAPAGKVICRRTLVAQALCTAIFPAGTYTIAPSGTGDYRVTRGGRLVAYGRATIRGRRVTLLGLRPLPHGSYQLAVTAGRGNRRQTLLNRIVHVR